MYVDDYLTIKNYDKLFAKDIKGVLFYILISVKRYFFDIEHQNLYTILSKL